MEKSLKFFAAGVLCVVALQVSAEFTLLHEFAGFGGDGQNPYYVKLTKDGSTLYGMTLYGGDDDRGVIFKVGTDGSGYSLLHEFAGGNEDGASPFGALTLDGTILYGMTHSGGDSNNGTVFKINTDGTGFVIMHEFANGADDGANPYGFLTLDGTTLYGMTRTGGDVNKGTIFKINTDGGGFALLHDFTDGTEDGALPLGSLILSKSILYGMTNDGGDSDKGTAFKIKTDGTGFALIHEFAAGVDDGSRPTGTLTLDGTKLYGMTYAGGDSDNGVIFKMNTDGSSFTLLREFAGGANDGGAPHGDLAVFGSTLYGMTRLGGDDELGTIFKIVTDGTGFTLLHEFDGGVNDGSIPYGSLIISGGKYYGMTYQGGDTGLGTVFSDSLVPVPQDFNGDKKSDVLAENSGALPNGYIYLMNGSTPSSNGEVYQKANSNWEITAYADFNGDGKTDILWTEGSTKEVLIYIMNGLSITELASILRGGTSWLVDQVADYNGDGRADILWRESTSGDGYMFLMNGTTIASEGWIQRGFDWQSKSSGDFNGDGKADILWQINSRIGYMYLMNGTAVSSEGQVYSSGLSSWSIDKFGDFNGDGKCDILWKYQGDGILAGYIYLMNGLAIDSSGYTYSTYTEDWTVSNVGDLNGDGKTDLLFQNSADGRGVGYIMNGITASSSGLIYTLTNNNWQVKKLLDFNADGKADILWQNTLTKKAVDYIMNGLVVSTSGTVFGEGTKTVIQPLL